VHDEYDRWFLGLVLRLYVEKRNLGSILGPNLQIRPRPGLRCFPDLLFISQARLSDVHETYLDGGPDLVVEVVSRGSKRRDRVQKFEEYAAAGIPEYWIVDHKARRMDAFALNAEGRYEPIPIEDGILRSRVVDGFWIRLDWLWQNPKPTTKSVQKELGLI